MWTIATCSAARSRIRSKLLTRHSTSLDSGDVTEAVTACNQCGTSRAYSYAQIQTSRNPLLAPAWFRRELLWPPTSGLLAIKWTPVLRWMCSGDSAADYLDSTSQLGAPTCCTLTCYDHARAVHDECLHSL